MIKVRNCTWARNNAQLGGAIFAAEGCRLSVSDTVFQENHAQVSSMMVRVLKRRIHEHLGGAIYAAEGCRLAVSHTDFQENHVQAKTVECEQAVWCSCETLCPCSSNHVMMF